MSGKWMERAETGQPWVIYTYGRTHDGWWPLWSSTRVLGRARVGLECCAELPGQSSLFDEEAS